MYDDAQDAVAAEYVLGTLSADEREHAEALLGIDIGFAEAVRVWERRLGELNVMVEAVEPPLQVWSRIRMEIGEVASPIATAPSAIESASSQPVAEPTSTVDALAHVASIAAALLPSSDRHAAEQVTAKASPAQPPAHSPPLGVAPAQPRIERSAEIVSLARSVSQWRRMTAAAGAIAVLLAAFVALTVFAPGVIQQAGLAPSSAPTQLGARLVAVLQQEPMSPAFLLTIDPQSRTLIVRRVSAGAESGHSYELWLISSRYTAPRSLGVVGADEFTERAIPSGFDIDTMRTASYAVSLEPAGGSRSGAPTGPILFRGKMVESVPLPRSSPLPPPPLPPPPHT
jgi:anti-sigma-K factor RskA